MLQISNVCFRYERSDNWLFRQFSFTVEKGNIVLIKGDSGEGKTTLLNIICGVIPKMIKGEFSGSIVIENTDIASLSLAQTAPLISLMLQEPDNQLFFPSVEQEMAFGPENMKIEPLEIRERMDKTLSALGIQKLRHKETHNLSFGQKKLVTLASLLTLDPQVFLIDELSAGLSTEFLFKIKQILQEKAAAGKIFFIADHSSDLDEIADLTIDLNKGNQHD